MMFLKCMSDATFKSINHYISMHWALWVYELWGLGLNKIELHHQREKLFMNGGGLISLPGKELS